MNTVGCTTGWVSYVNERSQAALGWSSQHAYDVIRLTRSKAAVWTVDVVARLIEILGKNSYLFILRSAAYDPEGWQKLDRIQNHVYKTLFIIYLFVI